MAIALDQGVVVSRVTLRYQNPKCRHHRIHISESLVDETGADVSPSSSFGKSWERSVGSQQRLINYKPFQAAMVCAFIWPFSGVNTAVPCKTRRLIHMLAMLTFFLLISLRPKTVCHSRYGHIDAAFLRYEFGCEQLERSSE